MKKVAIILSFLFYACYTSAQVDSSLAYTFKLYWEGSPITINDTDIFIITPNVNNGFVKQSVVVQGKDEDELAVKIQTDNTNAKTNYYYAPINHLYLTILNTQTDETMHIVVVNTSFYSNNTDEIQFTNGNFLIKRTITLNDWLYSSNDAIDEFENKGYIDYHYYRQGFEDKNNYSITSDKLRYTTKEPMQFYFTFYNKKNSFYTDGNNTAKVQYLLLKKTAQKWAIVKYFTLQMDWGESYKGIENPYIVKPINEPGIYKMQWLSSNNKIWESGEITIE